MKSNETSPLVERHPWPPFIPSSPRVLMLGTFPPKPERWSMEFYYPNRINDMWRIMGLVFMGDRDALWLDDEKRFDLPAIKRLLNEKGIALWDTGMAVRRLKDNASDKFLEIVEAIDLEALLDAHPGIEAVVTAGEKATAVVASLTGNPVPATGTSLPCKLGTHAFLHYRMPSSSRAYPLALEKKAAAYGQMFAQLGFEIARNSLPLQS